MGAADGDEEQGVGLGVSEIEDGGREVHMLQPGILAKQIR
jgi:hypothetical protein